MTAYFIEMTMNGKMYYNKYSTNLNKLIKMYNKEKGRLMSCSPNYIEESRHFKDWLAPYFSLEAQIHSIIYKVFISDIEIIEE